MQNERASRDRLPGLLFVAVACFHLTTCLGLRTRRELARPDLGILPVAHRRLPGRPNQPPGATSRPTARPARSPRSGCQRLPKAARRLSVPGQVLPVFRSNARHCLVSAVQSSYRLASPLPRRSGVVLRGRLRLLLRLVLSPREAREMGLPALVRRCRRGFPGNHARRLLSAHAPLVLRGCHQRRLLLHDGRLCADRTLPGTRIHPEEPSLVVRGTLLWTGGGCRPNFALLAVLMAVLLGMAIPFAQNAGARVRGPRRSVRTSCWQPTTMPAFRTPSNSATATNWPTASKTKVIPSPWQR